MQKQIVNRIEKLGGRVLKPRSETLRSRILAIRFPHVLYDQYWDVNGIDEYFDAHQETFHSDTAKSYNDLEAAYFSNDDGPRGQSFWKTKAFTPLTNGTDDCNEWSSCFNDPNMVDLKPVRDIVGDGKIEFLQIMYAYGYPDHCYVCLQDPKPNNPMVFGTDHEVFFRKYSFVEPLSQFLNRFITKAKMHQKLT